MKKCEKNKWKVLYSEITIHELKNHYSDERIKQVFSSFKDFIIFVSISAEQRLESKELALKKDQTHSADILHSILARDNKAVMVTRDKHFEVLKDIFQVMKPEDIIFY
ncbi:MAG: hypothetical protein COT90_05660 [Candidatus Diapherotrites archaeon CG10_big_fil_rev_8_21_14_0_10_31_34]|nr:MAG: hypothetical protein COT90_05660 [Candidatus Diapherotrites archaeon CG10_big_fil_rev_8_21_14_0_10_31_34]